LRLTEQDYTSLPADIILQTLLSLIACGFAVLNIGGTFKQIKISSEWEHKSWENIAPRASFYTFNHRGKHLYTDPKEELKQSQYRLLAQRTTQQSAARSQQAQQLQQEAEQEDPSSSSIEELSHDE
jgi:hypothetical protein